ncbi:MAG: hypothetical protein SVP26_05025 [Chloroflexota bacterium]|nr:hypothetical protein [Chloroflexota bacterium]
MRTAKAYGYYGAQKLVKSLVGDTGGVIRSAIFYPAVKDIGTLADLVNRVSWYLPHCASSHPQVSIAVDKTLLNTNLEDLAPPASQECYIRKAEHIHVVDSRAVDLSQADAIMLWNKESMFAPRVLRHLTRLSVVDPTYYLVLESVISQRLCAQTLEIRERERLAELSKENYKRLLEKVGHCDDAYVFGTGPSLDRATQFDYRGAFRVVCNSIVRNKALLHHIRPQLLAFVDHAFFFSPCRYAAEFRRMMLETVQEFQCYIMVQDFQVPLLLAHHPELEERIIGMPAPGIWDMRSSELIRTLLARRGGMPTPVKIPGHGEEYNFPTLDRFYVRLTASIMTLFMLPVVSSVCRNIYVVGADGRKPEEKQLWDYSSSSQFGNLMQTILETHPAVFRDSNYMHIYKRHCNEFKELVQYGEAAGKRYYALTPSHIPVLARRLVSGGETQTEPVL